MKRICSKCKKPVLKAHRWHQVHRRFLWFRWIRVEHRNCQRPAEGFVVDLSQKSNIGQAGVLSWGTNEDHPQ